MTYAFEKNDNSKEEDIKIKHSNEFIVNMGLGDPTTCVYQFVFDEDYSNDKNIIQHFIVHELGLCIKLDSVVAHMFYVWSLSHNTAGSIAIE